VSLRRWSASFRTRILFVVLSVTVLPLGLVGLWLTAAAARAGEEVITERVEAAVRDAAVLAGSRWITHRSGMLDVTDEESFWRALAIAASEGDAAVGREPPIAVISILRASTVPLGRVMVHDSVGRLIWEYDTGSPSARVLGPTIVVSVAVHASSMGPKLGTLQSQLAVVTLVPDNTPAPGGVGTMLGVYESDTGSPLAPLPFVLESETAREISWAGDRWILARRELVDPALVLVAAAPLSPFTAPYVGAARRGAMVLAVVGVLGLLLTLTLTNRMATSLERLAEAADAVAGGDLERSVDVRGDDEMSRVGRAFNQMTDNLKMSLQELSNSRALAAVGEFAAQLAHEIRNPLSAVRIDLQIVEEGLPGGSRLREIQERVLTEIERLDVTLSGALRTANSGRARDLVEVQEPLGAAVTSARTMAGQRGLKVVTQGFDKPAWVRGDAAALEQIFLNLLLNAVEASDGAGRIQASLSATDADVVIAVSDSGVGIAPEDLRHVYDPLYTTRRDGSGLGLTIARRLVIAHGGRIQIESEVGAGTVVRVLLPAEDVAAAGPSYRSTT